MKLPQDTTIYLGNPGAGKTFQLLARFEELLAAGVPPEEVAVLTFTRRAAEDVLKRAKWKFSYTEERLPWVRTIHSFVFRQLGYKRTQILSKRDLSKLGRLMGLEFSGGQWTEETYESVGGLGHGDRLLFLDNLARTMDVPLELIHEQSDHGIDWSELEMFSRAYALFKQQNGLKDFTDLLKDFVAAKRPPVVRALFIDEAQDLSRLQWKAVEIIAASCQKMYVGGDSKQAIFEWAGADLETYMSLPGNQVVLGQSNRLPAAPHAFSERVAAQLTKRQEAPFAPKPGPPGAVDWISDLSELRLESKGPRPADAPLEWLLLARTTYALKALEEHCIQTSVNFESPGRATPKSRMLAAIKAWEKLRQGVGVTPDEFEDMGRFVELPKAVLTKVRRRELKLIGPEHFKVVVPWFEGLEGIPVDEREILRATRRAGDKLFAEPRIRISTIHGAKGGEAENVLVLSDIPARAHQTMVRDPDIETRVFYVAVTRTLENLFIQAPRTNLYFNLDV